MIVIIRQSAVTVKALNDYDISKLWEVFCSGAMHRYQVGERQKDR